jgi:hypothetical protein
MAVREPLVLTTMEHGMEDRFACGLRAEERNLPSGAPIAKRSAVDGIHDSELHES